MAPFRDYLSSLLVRTPLEGAAKALRKASKSKERRKHPELADVYSEDERIDEALAKLVRPDWNCIDVGCHVGSFLSSVLGLAPSGRHMAFEPLPYKAKWLRKKFPEVEVHETSLGDHAGEITFYQNTEKSGFSSLVRHESDASRWREIVVKCTRLDDLVPEGRRIDLLKVDVEGFELPVFRGAEALLRRDRPILLFESTFEEKPEFDESKAALFRFLSVRNDYRLFTPKGLSSPGEALTEERFLAAHRYPFEALNFFAAPPEFSWPKVGPL